MIAASPIGTTDNYLYLLLGLLCLVMLSVAWWRRSRERRVTAREVTREQVARLRDQDEIRQSMEVLLSQLEEVSRRVSAQVDTELAKLTALIGQADERIAQLQGRPDMRAVTSSPPPVRNSPPARTERCARIYELADVGTPPLTIADTLQLPLGEVELVLNLRKFGA